MPRSVANKLRQPRRRSAEMKKITLRFLLVLAAVSFNSGPSIAAETCQQIVANDLRKCGTQPAGLLRPVSELNGCFEVKIKAASPWNATGVRLERGRRYEFKVLPDKVGEDPMWYDASLDATPEGWTEESHKEMNSGSWFVRWYVAATDWLGYRRVTSQDWFYLMGMVAEVGDQLIPIGNGTTDTIQRSGEFCAFANDLPWTYRNNKGSLMLRVQELGK